jgi:hypothetical protein
MATPLAQCDAFGFIYDQAGDPAADILVVLKRVLDASGSPILLSPKTTLTDSAGSFHFTLPEDATAYISARASALWNCPDGRPFKVPPGPSGELIPGFFLSDNANVEPPLVYVSDTLSIPRASASQDGYLSAADFVAFEAGAAEMGITQIDTGTGLTGGPITDTGTIALAPIPGVAGTWSNPTSITVNAEGQIIAISSGAPDTIPPVISAISTSALTGTSVTVTWTTNEPADSQVEYGITTSYGTSTTLDTSPVLTHSVPITGLTATTLYHYRVKSKDTAGNPTTSGDNTFTTTAGPDITAPVISAVTAGSLTTTGATITWTTDELADSQVEYGPTTSYGSSTGITNTSPRVTSHTVPLTGLAGATLYHYRVKSRDAAGNLQTGTDNSFTTTTPVDLLTDLVSMWQLEESGTAARLDSHGSNTLNPSATLASGTGKIGLAAHFPGDGPHLDIVTNSTIETGDVNYTIAFWVNLETNVADGDCVGKNAGSPIGAVVDEYIVGYEAPPGSDRFRFTVCGGGPVYTTVAANVLGSPTTGTWYFIVCWHDMSDGTINIQINDSPTFDTAVRTEPMNTGYAPLNVGQYGTPSVAAPSHFLHGFVDELAFWKGRVLNPAQRSALYNGGAGLPFSSWT